MPCPSFPGRALFVVFGPHLDPVSPAFPHRDNFGRIPLLAPRALALVLSFADSGARRQQPQLSAAIFNFAQIRRA